MIEGPKTPFGQIYLITGGGRAIVGPDTIWIDLAPGEEIAPPVERWGEPDSHPLDDISAWMDAMQAEPTYQPDRIIMPASRWHWIVMSEARQRLSKRAFRRWRARYRAACAQLASEE